MLLLKNINKEEIGTVTIKPPVEEASSSSSDEKEPVPASSEKSDSQDQILQGMMRNNLKHILKKEFKKVFMKHKEKKS